jgi:hypothetical protein
MWGGSGAPQDNGYVQVFSNYDAFVAMKADGSLSAWGHEDLGGSSAPTDNGYVQVFSDRFTFVAMKADGSLSAWGHEDLGGSGAPVTGGGGVNTPCTQ